MLFISKVLGCIIDMTISSDPRGKYWQFQLTSNPCVKFFFINLEKMSWASRYLFAHTRVYVVFLVAKGYVYSYPLYRGEPHLTLLSWPKRMAQYFREEKYVSVRNTMEQGASVLVSVAQSCPTLWDPVDYSLCPRDSPGKNTEVGSHSLLQGIFQTQGSNPGLPHCRQILYYLSYQGRTQSRRVWNLLCRLWQEPRFCLFCISVETGVWCQDRETLSPEEAATMRP